MLLAHGDLAPIDRKRPGRAVAAYPGAVHQGCERGPVEHRAVVRVGERDSVFQRGRSCRLARVVVRA